MSIINFKSGLVAKVTISLPNSGDGFLDQVCELWKNCSDRITDQTGVSIPVTITPSRLVYAAEAGCPFGGENSFNVTAVCNADYRSEIQTTEDYTDIWRSSFINIVYDCLTSIGASDTAIVYFSDGEATYISK